ncbi:hypothetical protein CR513_37137, partial [Mucuna pruriens]
MPVTRNQANSTIKGDEDTLQRLLRAMASLHERSGEHSRLSAKAIRRQWEAEERHRLAEEQYTEALKMNPRPSHPPASFQTQEYISGGIIPGHLKGFGRPGEFGQRPLLFDVPKARTPHDQFERVLRNPLWVCRGTSGDKGNGGNRDDIRDESKVSTPHLCMKYLEGKVNFCQLLRPGPRLVPPVGRLKIVPYGGVEGGTTNFDLYLIHPNKTGLRKVIQSGLGGRINHPCFSPNGNTIVFASDYASILMEPISNSDNALPYGEMFNDRLDGSGLKRLTHDLYEDGTPAWSPNYIQPVDVERPNARPYCSFNDYDIFNKMPNTTTMSVPNPQYLMHYLIKAGVKSHDSILRDTPSPPPPKAGRRQRKGERGHTGKGHKSHLCQSPSLRRGAVRG